MKKSFLPTLFSLFIVFLLSNIHANGEISTFVFILLCILAVIFSHALAFDIRNQGKSKVIKKLKSHSNLLTSNPEAYLSMCDELMKDTKAVEYDYLILHKGNVLARLNRNKEAIKVLRSNVPYYLDETNAGIYYTNLMGLYIREKEFKKAKNVLDSNRVLIDKLESHKTRGYSVMVNKASLFHHYGDDKRALEEAKKAFELVQEESSKNEIRKFIEKLEKD